MNFPEVWDLERIFAGGSDSPSFKSTYKETEKNIQSLEKLLKEKKISDAIFLLQSLGKTLREMDCFICCLLSQNIEDIKATVLASQLQVLQTSFSNCNLSFDALLKELLDKDFETLIKKHPPIAFILSEKRKLAKEKLGFEEEAFINQLSMSGYHGWSQLWDALIGEMVFPFDEEALSFGQIENKMSHPDRAIRKKAFLVIEETFKKRETSLSHTLNNIGGFRLEVYKKRGWKDFLKEPLEHNRLSKKSLMTMWETIEKNQDSLVSYLKCKSALLGLDKLSWYDLEAPLASSSKEISYEKASETIINQFSAFSPQMAAFAKRALEDRFIEAEDRKGKRPGGYCCALPKSCESRIFMTFSKTMTNLFTLAHELGHAFHNEVIFPLDEMVQHPTMGLAETASTMAEMIVTKATIQNETDPKERLLLLDDHLSRAVAYLMNIYARFLFETQFFEKRKKGFVTHKELSELMEASQKKAYGNALETYHPLFWAAKMHFFFTDVPFYNFPYAFGYLFSLGIYTYANKHPNFEESYISLLKDTGRMTTEDLAKKHLNADLSTPSFWQEGLDVINKDIQEYIQLSKKV